MPSSSTAHVILTTLSKAKPTAGMQAVGASFGTVGMDRNIGRLIPSTLWCRAEKEGRKLFAFSEADLNFLCNSLAEDTKDFVDVDVPLSIVTLSLSLSLQNVPGNGIPKGGV